MKRIDLRGKWQFSGDDGLRHTGNVPGCVHTDLFHKEELFYETNSETCRFIEEKEWKYEKSFTVEEVLPNPILVFEGLDTYCEIYLNHRKIGSADNMFIPHRFEVEGVLREGENFLEILFLSPVKAVEGKSKLEGSFTVERLHTRRMQCTYGWDWVERFVTCGIYRPVYLTFEDRMSVEDVYIYTVGVDTYSAQVKIVEHFKNFEKGSLVKTIILDPQGETKYCREFYCEENEYSLSVDIEKPQLWFPKPYGEQPLYELLIVIGEETHRQKFGIRTVKILELPDKDASVIAKCHKLQETESGKEYDANTEYAGFILIINGVRIFCTGANWVPCEPFPSAETDEKITLLLEKSVKAGVNMIRVWGGGLFEKEHFYDECDRLGILVTQDFLMACGEYPEDDENFQAQLKKEVEYAAVYLRNHPSLVWWTGDNENAILGDDKMPKHSGRTSSRKVIAPILEKLDYNRRFLLSSPYGGQTYASKTVGTTHNTQFMGSIFQYLSHEDISNYREYWETYTARFIAEEPILGAVSRQTLREFVSEEHEQDYDIWLYHTKTNPALKREIMDIAIEFAEKLFGEFRDWEERCFKLRYLQYEWVRFSFCIARSNLWFNSGIVYWMLNDCWPAAIGWSLLDYYAREKAGYYALQAYGKETTVYIRKAENGYTLHISNILNHPIECKVQTYVLNTRTGCKTDVLCESIILTSECQMRELSVLLEPDEIIIADVSTGESVQRNWYREGAPLLKRVAHIDWNLAEHMLEIWSDTYVHAVEIEGAENLSDNYFSLLPGERKCVTYSSKETIRVNGYTFK